MRWNTASSSRHSRTSRSCCGALVSSRVRVPWIGSASFSCVTGIFTAASSRTSSPGLSEDQVRRRPDPRVNTIAWLLWHAARIEDVGVNGFVADRPQVLDDEEWLGRMKLVRRDVGTGMDDSEVDELSLTIDLNALRGYWDAVTRRTLAVVETLRGQDLEALVPMERVRRV